MYTKFRCSIWNRYSNAIQVAGYVGKQCIFISLGCYVGVTYGAFAPDTTLWLDVCSNQNLNASLCGVFPSDDCSDLCIVDMVITRNYIVFATSFGLVKSASFALLLSGLSVPKVI